MTDKDKARSMWWLTGSASAGVGMGMYEHPGLGFFVFGIMVCFAILFGKLMDDVTIPEPDSREDNTG